MCQHDTRPVLTVVRVFLKNGRTQTLPYRTAPRAGCTSCVGHAEQRFLGWLRQMNAAQPGFSTMIRSVFVRVYGPGCANCEAQLVRVLGRYRLADKLRYVARPDANSGCNCGCKRAADYRQFAGVCIAHDNEAILENKLPKSPSSYRSKAQRQADKKFQQTGNTAYNRKRPGEKTRQVDHGIPFYLLQSYPELRDDPNVRNLRVLPHEAHVEKERMLKKYILSRLKEGTSLDQLRRHIKYIFTKLRERYDISPAFEQERELLELELF